jgi:Tol biopolymer transport system component
MRNMPIPAPWLIGLVFFLPLIHPTLTVAALLPAGAEVRRTSSEHFIYLFEAELADQVPLLQKHCEDAHAALSPIFNWSPRRKTLVIYTDAMDLHNGMATIYPQPLMVLYAMSAHPATTIFEGGNDLRRTVFHEYAHILGMDAQYGFDAALSRIFGRGLLLAGDPLSALLMFLAAPPGVLAPRWYQEGLAMWVETEFVGPGRGRNARTDMLMRMAVADDQVLTPPYWDISLPEWPYGTAPYLYGLKVFDHIFETYGVDGGGTNLPAQLSDDVARSFFFNFNNRAWARTEKRFSDLAVAAMQAEKERQQRRITALESQSFTALRRLTPPSLVTAQPKFGPLGQRIYLTARGEAGRQTLSYYDTKAGALVKLDAARVTDALTTDMAMGADRNTLYYTRLDFQGRDRIRNEIYAYGLNDRRRRRIAADGRYRYLGIHPDGGQMTAITERAGRSLLVSVPLLRPVDPGAETVLATAAEGEQFTDLALDPSGDGLVYVRTDGQGAELIYLDAEHQRQKSLLKWSCAILSPTFHPTRRSLVFSADRNGVFNLYHLDIGTGAAPVPLTHVLGGVFEPDFSPDGRLLAATAYDADGYYLTLLEAPYTTSPQAPLPVIAPEWRSLPQNLALKKRQEASPPPDTRAAAAAPYNSFAEIGFDAWSPWLTASSEGIMGGVLAGFSDPVQYQGLTVAAGVESAYLEPVAAVRYDYGGFFPEITLQADTTPITYPGLILDDEDDYYDYGEQRHRLTAAVTLPWNRVDFQAALSLGYQLEDRYAIEETTDDFAGEVILTQGLSEALSSALWGRFSFFDATAFGRSHSMEDGRHLSLVAERADKALGSEIDRTRLRADWREYLPLPWGWENHVIRLEAVYGRGWGDETAQGAFGLGGLGFSLLPPLGVDRGISLRGYESNYRVGDEAVKLGAAYRLPLWRPYRNINATFPFYLQQLFMEIFYEGGRINDTTIVGADNDWLSAAGVEVNFATKLLRFLPVAPGLGVAYAFDREARDGEGDSLSEKWSLYLSIKTSVNF